MIMPIDDYSGWFGEAVNDPHTDFSLVLHTYRPDADNAATLEKPDVYGGTGIVTGTECS